jgi:DNA-binding NarL/FixJ family response regulator
MIRIVIADDHAIVRQGLARILEKSGEMKVVAEHDNGLDALKWLRIHDCDIAVVDISMPGMNGIDLLKQLHELKPQLPVLIVSIYSEDQYAVRLIKAGASGYLAKGCSPSILLKAVNRIISGKKYISPAVAEMLADEVGAPDGKVSHETLSDREYQIFLMITSAKTVSEIAEALSLSGKTISTYRSRILQKMHLRNNAEMMRYAVDNKLT